MEREPRSQTATLAELFLKTVILALKVLIPMIWLRSKLSPIQFIIGGTALVLAAFLFYFSPTQDSGCPPSMRPSNLRDPGRVERLKAKGPD